MVLRINYMYIGCPWYESKGQPCNPNLYKSLFSLAYTPFHYCVKHYFLVQIVQVLWDGCEKKQYGMTLLLTFCK